MASVTVRCDATRAKARLRPRARPQARGDSASVACDHHPRNAQNVGGAPA